MRACSAVQTAYCVGYNSRSVVTGWAHSTSGSCCDPLVTFIVEAVGGIARAGRAQCGLLTRRAKATSARDRTTYGRARNSTRLFYLHHTRLIAKAAVVNDAMGIREQVQGLRQRVCAAHAAASGWP